MRVSRIEYKGWHNAWLVENARMRLIITGDVGPRVIHFGLSGGENQFYEVETQAGLRGGSEFRMYGGHRLWVAPETERTSYPDNEPVDVAEKQGGVVFTAPCESTGLQKALELRLAEDAAEVSVMHYVTNCGSRPDNVAPWALTVLRPGGRAIVPLPPRAPWSARTLLPTSSLALWPYTNLSARCWRLGPRYIQLQQPLAAEEGFGMQKLGIRNPAGWGAYYRAGSLFIKRTEWREGAYPDFGSNFEIFADKDFIELETLAPERTLQPGESATHLERWSLTTDIEDGEGEEWVESEVVGRAKAVGG